MKKRLLTWRFVFLLGVVLLAVKTVWALSPACLESLKVISGSPKFRKIQIYMNTLLDPTRNSLERSLAAAALAKEGFSDPREAVAVVGPIGELIDAPVVDEEIRRSAGMVLQKAMAVFQADHAEDLRAVASEGKALAERAYDRRKVAELAFEILEYKGGHADKAFMQAVANLMNIRALSIVNEVVLPVLRTRQQLAILSGQRSVLEVIDYALAELRKTAEEETLSPFSRRKRAAEQTFELLQADTILPLNEIQAEAILRTHVALEKLGSLPPEMRPLQSDLDAFKGKDERAKLRAQLKAAYLFLYTDLMAQRNPYTQILKRICVEGGKGPMASVASYAVNCGLVAQERAGKKYSELPIETEHPADGRTKQELDRLRKLVLQGDAGALYSLTFVNGISEADYVLVAAEIDKPGVDLNLRDRLRLHLASAVYQLEIRASRPRSGDSVKVLADKLKAKWSALNQKFNNPDSSLTEDEISLREELEVGNPKITSWVIHLTEAGRETRAPEPNYPYWRSTYEDDFLPNYSQIAGKPEKRAKARDAFRRLAALAYTSPDEFLSYLESDPAVVAKTVVFLTQGKFDDPEFNSMRNEALDRIELRLREALQKVESDPVRKKLVSNHLKLVIEERKPKDESTGAPK
jgi:hypothetical protein